MKIIILFFVFAFIATDNIAQEKNYRFHKVFFYSFTKYIEWPEEQQKGDFIIAVVGNSEITPLLKEMAEIKKVDERTIKIVELTNLKQNDFCHILFLPSKQNQKFAEIRSKLSDQPALIVTETDGMAKRGAMINFKDVDGKLRFEVNTKSLESSGLKMSKELIRFGEEIN